MIIPQTETRPTFNVYVDESGDEGFRFGAGSSEWLVLSAVITQSSKDLEAVKLVDTVRAKLGKPSKKPLHFRDLKHEQRLVFVGEIVRTDLAIISMLIHKPSIQQREIFKERYRLYFYAVRYLLERVSWYCRDLAAIDDVGNRSANIVFSNRSGMSYEEMKRYLDILRFKSDTDDIRIDWSVVKPYQIEVLTPGKQMGLQLSDAVASSFYYAMEYRYGYTEDRYARMLKPVVYNRQGDYLGYGLKFWPIQVEERVDTEERFEWVRKEYK